MIDEKISSMVQVYRSIAYGPKSFEGEQGIKNKHFFEKGQMYLKSAYEEASKSLDKSTQLGAVIVGFDFIDYGIQDLYQEEVLGSGHNRFLHNVKVTSERLDRPLKYYYTEHAERTAIYDYLINYDFEDPYTDIVLFCPWFACADCARAIVQSGVTHVVGHYEACLFAAKNNSWNESIVHGYEILKESGIQFGLISGQIHGAKSVRINGQIFNPSNPIIG